MNITMIGTGYVGLIAGLGFADFGNEVICYDTNREMIDKLNSGICPIYEIGAESLLKKHRASGKIKFTDHAEEAVKHGEVIFITVGTPEGVEGNADLSYVFQAAESIGRYIVSNTVVVNKSTVPVGTGQKVKEIIEKEIEKRDGNIIFHMVSNPEFLREGKAIDDFYNPSRIVIGAENEKAIMKIRSIYRVFDRSNKPIIVTDIQTAETIKYASNAFLATKIAFINEMANFCEKVGANVLDVAAAMGKDGRIAATFLHPGPGYGGACFPKDTKAIAALGREYGAPLTIIESVILSNQHQKELSAQKILDRMPDGGVLAFLGLSFKPETDDIRESPAMEIIKILNSRGGFTLRLYDPQSMENAKIELKDLKNINLIWCNDSESTFFGASAVALVTEWVEFRSFDLHKMSKVYRIQTLFDFRNMYRKSEANEAGIEYVGRGV